MIQVICKKTCHSGTVKSSTPLVEMDNLQNILCHIRLQKVFSCKRPSYPERSNRQGKLSIQQNDQLRKFCLLAG